MTEHRRQWTELMAPSDVIEALKVDRRVEMSKDGGDTWQMVGKKTVIYRLGQEYRYRVEILAGMSDRTETSAEEVLAVMEFAASDLRIAQEAFDRGEKMHGLDKASARLMQAHAAVATLISGRDAYRDVLREFQSLLRAAADEVVAADVEFDAARAEHAEALYAKGAWNVNPLPYTHPACVRLRAAIDRRAAAIVAYKEIPA